MQKMSGTKLNKLALNRETLQPLQTVGADELGGVQGGTGLPCRLSIRYCSQIVSALVCSK